ncbi:hypothetical protein ASE14_16015 [Agromyces sp. Root81]|uniref:GyrI-like domain-containing protein n=1 Tax=Agromyces sp. Root81 TaxID=1736601 RepID=UPI0006FCAB7D|nr:GyrI-like domain-containing protein [Agromyces sp. Root81]KRC59435.1 hypothetical protein ASE14_16015 [Agromyces sp. Root81]
MEKFDAKRAHRELYAPPTEFVFVDVPEILYLAVDGHGDPNTAPEYAAALEALYAVAYTIKFASKGAGRDFVVGPLEGLWRADDETAFTSRRKEEWSWTLMLAQPDWVTPAEVEAAIATVGAKKSLPSLGLVKPLRYAEGRSVQILHRGPYDDEAPTLARLHDEFIPDHGLAFNGDHHEIYLTDARRTAPDKLRTVLRQPVRPV